MFNVFNHTQWNTVTRPVESAFFLGRAMYQAERFEEARASFEEARARRGFVSRRRARNRESLCFASRRRLRRGELRRAVEADPSDFEARYFLGGHLVQQGKVEEGLALLERARLERSGFWAPHYYVGKALLQSGDLDGAIRRLEDAVKLNPEESSAWYQLGLALQKAGRSAEARAAMDRVRRLKRQ